MTSRIFAVIWLTLVTGCGFGSTRQREDYRFFATDGRIYALENGGGYGNEGPLYASDDVGQTWTKANTPDATCDLTGNGRESFALTSKGEIWNRVGNDEPWKLLKQGSSTAFGPREYLYHVSASKEGTVCVAANKELWLLDRSGKLVKRFSSPKSSASPGKERFLRAWFADADEQKLIVEASPFAVYVLDLPKQELISWTDGVKGEPPGGMHGPCRVIQHGDRYLMSTHDGVYIADGLLMPWRRLTQSVDLDDYLRQQFCRAFCSFDSAEDQWLMADGAGIHLMRGGKKLRTVFTDKPDEHDLIQDITLHEGRYFVSFYRLKEGVLGVVLSEDLSSWKTLSLGTEHLSE